MVQFAFLGPLLELINGPIFSIIDKLVPDHALKARLKAEIKSRMLANANELAKSQRDILLAEIGAGSLLTRAWRPALMYVIVLFLLFYGLILPLADLIVGHEISFSPRWDDIPDGLWNLLSLGVGGYVGGRSLEKIASSLKNRSTKAPIARDNGWNRKNNLL